MAWAHVGIGRIRIEVCAGWIEDRCICLELRRGFDGGDAGPRSRSRNGDLLSSDSSSH